MLLIFLYIVVMICGYIIYFTYFLYRVFTCYRKSKQRGDTEAVLVFVGTPLKHFFTQIDEANYQSKIGDHKDILYIYDTLYILRDRLQDHMLDANSPYLSCTSYQKVPKTSSTSTFYATTYRVMA